jgi:hypothetical protein
MVDRYQIGVVVVLVLIIGLAIFVSFKLDNQKNKKV